MKLIRIASLALAVLLPTAWTVAKAADEPPPAGSDTDKSKSSKKSKKSGKKSGDTSKSDTGDKKPDSDMAK